MNHRTVSLLLIPTCIACGEVVDPAADGGSSSGGPAPDTTGGALATTMTPDPSTTSGPSTLGDGGSSGPDSSDDGSSSSGTPTGFHTVRGSLTRSVQLWPTNDGIGDAYLLIADVCGFDPMQIAVGTVYDADLSADDAEVAFEIPGVPNGTWQFLAFFDDNQNSMLPEPGPDQGDLVRSEGFGVGCVEVVVDGADVDGVTLDFNFVLPEGQT